MKKTLILSIVVAVISSCSSMKSGADADAVTMTGEMKPLGMTTFQYGTHAIKSEDTLYALRISTVNLKDFEDKSVTLICTKVSGYPLEGGPELIEVSAISEVQQETKSAQMKTRLGSANNAFTKDSIMLSFTVFNESDTVRRFCKWETPFDPGIGKYMDILDAQGTEPSFIGAMARRVMPPPPESYIEVPPHDSLKTVFNLADNYAIKAGQYTVRYSGGAMGDFIAGNEIKITVVD